MFERTQPDPSRPPIWLRRGRRRSDLDVRTLIDSRMLSRLCAAGAEPALAAFRATAAPLGTGLPPLELTPLAFLDALGVQPPPSEAFPLPPAVLKAGEAVMATTVVFKIVEERLREVPELQAEALRKRGEEIRQGLAPAAHELFDLCVTQAMAGETFVDPIIRQLAFDSVYRFPFPEVLREEIFEFLCASLFAADETVSGLSKMRMIKTLWDRAYPWLLKANPAAREEIQALDREMRLRTRADYLAWEVVHHAALGLSVGDSVHPATSYLFDSTPHVKARCTVYKSALRSFLDQISRADLAELRPKLDLWRPGTLVPCRDDGTCEAPVPTGDLPVFVGMRSDWA